MSEVILERDDEDLRLRIGDTEVGHYRAADPGIPAVNTPKPYLHPLRTLSGVAFTGFAPDDHPWHHGLEFAFPRVGAHNLWGGGTYFGPDDGYVVVEDQGRIAHRGWTSIGDDGTFTQRIDWIGHAEEHLIAEHRNHRLSAAVAAGVDGWMLQLDSTLRNLGAESVRLETPAQRGRDDGGYGGWFLRFAEGFTADRLTVDGEVADGSGAHGSTFVIEGRTLAGDAVTIGMHYGPGANAGERRWLYRFTPFSLAGFAVAYQDGLSITAGSEISFSHRIAVFDGVIAPDAIETALRA